MMLPRVLLLTRWPPDGRYAGGEVLRRTLRLLPRDRIVWFTLEQPKGPVPRELPLHETAPVRRLHWRLANSFAEYLYVDHVQAAMVARVVADRAREFRPEVIWLYPELSAIAVGRHLARRLGLPVHATVYDTLESAGEICVPSSYFPLYMREVRRLFSGLASVDAVSEELLRHIRECYGVSDDLAVMVNHPSVPGSWALPEAVAPPEGRVRRIGFCGAFRVTEGQWESFLRLLAAQPHEFEFVAFAAADSVPRAVMPRNVRWRMMPYVEDERRLIRAFRDERVCAGYLGLYRDAARRSFSRTSLSSKLTTYAAAGLPVIVDGPEDSVAWRLVSQYGAGILLGEASAAALERILSDGIGWRQMAEGSQRLCAGEFNLERHVAELGTLLSRAADRDG